jgi:hypothetical protein
MFEDEDEFGVDITGQHHALLRIELLDAGFGSKAINYAFNQLTPEQLELCANMAASASYQNKSFAALIVERELFTQQAIVAARHENPVLRETGLALLELQNQLIATGG